MWYCTVVGTVHDWYVQMVVWSVNVVVVSNRLVQLIFVILIFGWCVVCMLLVCGCGWYVLMCLCDQYG